MRLLFERNDPQIYESNAQRAARMQTYMATATPELADKLGSARTTYNWVNPGILTSMVLSNNEPALQEVAKVVGEKAFVRGISPADGIRSRMTVQEQLAARQRTVNRLSGVTPTPETGRTTAPKEETPFGEDNRVNLFKALTNGFLAGAAFIPQVAANVIYQGMNYLPSGKSFKTQRDKSLVDQFLIGPVKQTFFGQLVQESISAAVSDEKASFKEIAGGAFWPGGKVVEDQARAAAQYRPLVGESQKPYTFGRSMGSGLADIGVIEEGSLAYNLISGVIDAGVAMRLDPTFGKPLKQPFGSRGPALSAVPEVVQEVEDMRRSAGLVNGVQKTVNRIQWDDWKTSPKGVRTLEGFVNEKDPATVWRNLGRQGIFTADNIAKADNHNGVVSALESAVTELDETAHVRNIPAGGLRPSADAGYKLKQSAQRLTNFFEVYPESTFIPNDNPNVAAKRLDDLMGFLGFNIETRNLWINKWIETAKDGTSKSFFNYLSDWEKTVLEDALVKNGVPKTEARQLAKWKNSTVDVFNRWTLQDLADGAPPAWMEGGGLGPVRNTQLLKNGAHVIDPVLVPEVTRRLGKLYKFQAEAEKLPGVVGWPISKVLSGTEILGDAYGWYASEIWKPIVIAAVRYVTRIVPNEQARVLLNQTFEHPAHYALAIADGRFAAKLGVKGMYVADVFGETMNKSKMLVQLEQDIIQANVLVKQIDDLVKAGDDAGANLLRNKYAKELAELPKKLVRQEELEQLLDDGMPSLNEALIGQTPKAAREALVKNYGTGYFDRSGISVLVSRNVAKEQPSWVKGIAQELADLHANPHYRVIAAGKMSDEQIAQWLFKGDGRKYFEKYFKNFANLKEGYNWDTIENARDFVRISKNEITSVAGTNKEALDLIATGQFKGAPAFTLDKYKVRDSSDDVKAFIENTLLESNDMPSHVRYIPRVNIEGFRGEKGGQAKEKYDFVLDLFFKSLYGMPSDKLARSPAFRAGYWGRVEEVASLANKEAADQLLKNLEKANLPRPQADRIKLILSRAKGVNDLETIDDSARAFGLSYERKLLFDATNKSRFGAQTKYIFDFFEAWREEGTTWAKLLTEYPANGHKIDVALRSLQGVTDLGPGDVNYDGKKDGFLYTDPQTGEQRVALRGTGALGRLFANIPFAGFSMPLGSLTMFTSIGPGFGPLFQYPAQFFIPATKNWDLVNKIVFPYGRPSETGQQPVGGLLSLEVTRPTWLKRMAPFAADVFEKYTPDSFGQFMSDAIKELSGNPEESEAYKAFYNKTLQSKASTLESPPKTKREMQDFFDDVEESTNVLYALRGLGNFVLPGIPVATFMAESKQGPVELGILADKMREYKKEAVEAGQTERDGELRFFDVYGTQVWAIMGSIRESKKFGGLVYSREFEDWFTKNTDFVDTYPAVAGYFGPQTEPGKWGPTEQNVYNRFVARGVIQVQSPEELIREAQSNVAYSVYDGIRSKMTLAQQNSKQGQEALKTLRESLQEEFPEWDVALLTQESKSRRADQIQSLYEIINEPQVQGTTMGQAVASYLALRDATIEEAFKAGVKGWDTDSKKSVPYRIRLYAVGNGFAQAVPQFRPLWERVLSKEFKDPTVQE